MTHIQASTAFNDNLSLRVGGLRINVNDYHTMNMILKSLSIVVDRLEKEVGTRANLVVNQMLTTDTYLSCRMRDGKAELAVYRDYEKNLLVRIDRQDADPDSFEAASRVLIKQALDHARILEKGGKVPEDAEIIGEWAKLDRKREDIIL